MNTELNDKIAKIYALVTDGGTEGEKQAARKALDRLMKKYNLDESYLNGLDTKEYTFTYRTQLELDLLNAIVSVMAPDCAGGGYYRYKINIKLKYIDWVTVESAYEYFRRHMRKEWNRVCGEELKRCRKSKTLKKRRTQLQQLFITKYLIASNLVKPTDLVKVEVKSEREMNDRIRMMAVSGGKFNRQIVGGLMLEEKC